MPEISEKYASPGLRWGLYKHDHPQAKKPKHEIMDAKQVEALFGLPAEFGGESEDYTGRYVVCTIDPGDGGEVAQAYKEIPKREKKYKDWVEFAKTPEHWRKLCTQALGRTLKEAGYPDDTDDLKALLLWRRRSVELEMLAQGGPLAQIGPSPEPANGELDAAAKADPLAEHPDEPVIDGEEPTVDDLAWSPEAAETLRPIVSQFAPEQVDALEDWAYQRGKTEWWTLTGGPLKTVVAYAKTLEPAA